LHQNYHDKGLRILAFHRPEFAFEKDPFNMLEFIQRAEIPYPVGLDNDDIAWNTWGVEFWPQHYLLKVHPEDADKGFEITYEHFGDRNHHELEEKIVQLLWTKEETSPRPTIHPFNHEVYFDVEFFLGKSHRPKNLEKKAAHDCSDGVCRIRPTKTTGGKNAVPLPDATVEYTVYGAAWCRFCRKSKLLLEEEKIPFAYFDADIYGGPQTVKEQLNGLKQNPLPTTHNTIPIIYHKDVFVGGFSDLVAKLKNEGKASEEVLGVLEEKSNQSAVEYNKGGHEVTVSLDASQWDTTPEYLLAKGDHASLTVKFEINNRGAHVNLYVVGEPPNDERVVQSRAEFLEAIKGKEGKHAIFNADGSLYLNGQKVESVVLKNAFTPAIVEVHSLDTDKRKQTDIAYADRHWIDVFQSPPAGEKKEEEGEEANNAMGHLQLSFQRNTKVYVLYFTTEPRSA